MKRFLLKFGFNGKVLCFTISLGLLILLSTGCKSKYPPDILKPEEIKPVLFDVMVATAVRQMDTTTATKQHIRDSITLEIHRVLAAHKIDDSLYFRSMAFYEAHPDYLKSLLDSTRAYGNRLQDSLQKKRFAAPDSSHQPAIQPRSLKPAAGPAVAPPKKPVNPTVKDSAAVPVEKVKKGLKKQN
jgi:hypothetical protein